MDDVRANRGDDDLRFARNAACPFDGRCPTHPTIVGSSVSGDEPSLKPRKTATPNPQLGLWVDAAP
jgi:hypothetical protein